MAAPYGFTSEKLAAGFTPPLGLAGPYTDASALSYANLFKLPPKTNHLQRTGPWNVTIAPSSEPVDLQAPGVRDGIARPAPFATTIQRGSLFDTNRVENNAPLPNWDYAWSTFTAPNVQRLGSYWWENTHDVRNKRTPGMFIDQGEYLVPRTGFTALRYLRPASTLKPI